MPNSVRWWKHGGKKTKTMENSRKSMKDIELWKCADYECTVKARWIRDESEGYIVGDKTYTNKGITRPYSSDETEDFPSI
jgi:hypothetical protein